MDPFQFDMLTKALSLALSRRSIARYGFPALVGFSTVLSADITQAKKKPCPPCKGRKKGKCKKLLPDGSPCDGGTCQAGACIPALPPPPPPPPPSPSPKCEPKDGIKNGTETGIDCGGLCPRCSNGQGCLTQDDCLSAFCANGVCQECGINLCGADANGTCVCQFPISGNTKVCRTAKGTADSSCLCAPGARCYNASVTGCYKLCGQ